MLVALAALGAAGCRSVSAPEASAPEDRDAAPQIPPFVNPAFVHFTRSQVQVGDVAPDFTLARIDGDGDVTLSDLRGRPAVLVFGSFT
jgi:hypothetical protein